MVFTEILYYAVLFVSVLISVYLTIRAAVEKKKRVKDVGSDGETNSETCESDNEPVSLRIIKSLPQWISSAEKLYNSIVPSGLQKTGAQKLEYVLDKAKIDCLTHNENFNEQEITAEINNLIDFSNEVNVNKSK